MLRNSLLNKIKYSTRKYILYSKEDDISLDESNGEDVREVLFITKETQNDDHNNYEIEEIDFEEEFDEVTSFDSF
jgi:hypothetical protein